MNAFYLSPTRLMPRVILALLAALVVMAAVTLPVTASQRQRAPEGRQAIPGLELSPAQIREGERTSIDEIVRNSRPMRAPRHTVAVGLASDEPRGTTERHAGAAAGQPAPLTAPSSASAAQNGAWTGAFNQAPNRQIGVLFFDTKIGNGEVWSHCSATAINSENRSTVVTAGHCVFNPDPDENGRVDGNGYWYEHVQFCPGYQYGCKLGRWHSRAMWTTPSWFYGSGANRAYDWRDDVAMVVVKSNPSKGLLVNAVGAQGIAFNESVGIMRHAFGYPASDWRFPAFVYDGKDLIYCRGRDVYAAGRVLIACTMTGGASGGPWLIRPNASWGGYVNSVNSHKESGPTMSGPYFGSAEQELFRYVRAR
jgi:hypothetical protein